MIKQIDYVYVSLYHTILIECQRIRTCSRMADFTLVYILKKYTVTSRKKCEFATQLSRGGDQRCRIRNRIRIQSRIRNKS
jgi:hypothetical protein